MMKKALLLLLIMLIAMPTLGIAHEFSFDNVSGKYPHDAEYFAFEASQTLAKAYEKPQEVNLILLPAKNDKLINNLSTYLVRSGFTLNDKTDGTALSYTFDFIDKKRAYLRLELSDGKHVGVVRNLGEQGPFAAPAADTASTVFAPATKVEDIEENRQAQEHVKPAPQLNRQAPAQTALSELSANPTPLLPSVPQTKVWILRPGSLMNQLDEWARGESWKLIWQANYDLDLNADATFSGDFIKVVEQIFNSLPRKNNGLRVSIYKQNKVVEIIGE